METLSLLQYAITSINFMRNERGNSETNCAQQMNDLNLFYLMDRM